MTNPEKDTPFLKDVQNNNDQVSMTSTEQDSSDRLEKVMSNLKKNITPENGYSKETLEDLDWLTTYYNNQSK